MSNVVDVKNLNWAYRNKEVLENISFSVAQGEIITLMGVNGCGKTTLLNCLMGFLKVSKRTVYLCGKDIADLSSIAKAQLVSYVSQNIDANCLLTVYEYLSLGLIAHKKFYELTNKVDKEHITSCASKMNIHALLDKKMNEISGGERQLAAITRALIQDTPIIIFDEPMSALDYKNQIKYLKVIDGLRKMGKTIIFSSHNPNHALSLKSKVCLLNDMKNLAVGESFYVLTKENLMLVYGEEVDVICNGEKQYCVFDL